MKTHLYFLIIDDDNDIHEVLKGYIRNVLVPPEYDVKLNFYCADSVKKAHSILANNPIQIAFLDIGLPDGDGMEVLQELTYAYPHVKVAMISGDFSKKDVVKAAEFGVLGFLTKPFNRAKIANIISRFYHHLTSD